MVTEDHASKRGCGKRCFELGIGEEKTSPVNS